MPRHILIKLSKIKYKEKILKAVREKQQITYMEIPMRLKPDFSAETLQARREWQDILKVMKKKNLQGFPGGAVVENLPANAGDTGSSPGLGRSHMPRSGWARGPRLLSRRVWSLCPAAGGAAMVRGPRTAMKSGPRTVMKSGPHLPQLEKALARTEDPTQTKINK